MIHPITAEQMQRDYAKARRVFPKPERHVTAKDLARQFARDHGIPVRDFFGNSRAWEISHPRQDFWASLHLEVGIGYAAIGRMFKRDHTTVMHGVEASLRRASQ